MQDTRDSFANTSDFDTEIVSEDEEGQLIPANVFFPERVNILKKNEWIKFKKWGDDPCETVFAIRLFGYRVNLQRCECFQFIFLVLMIIWIVLILIGKNYLELFYKLTFISVTNLLAATARNARIDAQRAQNAAIRH